MRHKTLPHFSLTTTPKQSQSDYYVVVNGLQAGPMTEAELKTLVKKGSVSADTLVWTPLLVKWTPAQLVPSVNKLLLLFHKDEKNAVLSKVSEIENPIRKDLISSMTHLGFRSNIVSSVVNQVLNDYPNISLEEGVKEVLKRLGE